MTNDQKILKRECAKIGESCTDMYAVSTGAFVLVVKELRHLNYNLQSTIEAINGLSEALWTAHRNSR